jgi:hypothetical protein
MATEMDQSKCHKKKSKSESLSYPLENNGDEKKQEKELEAGVQGGRGPPG